MGAKASKFGSIAITLDDPYFVAGDFVKGQVHLDCKQSFYANQLLLIIDGRQYAEIQDKKKTHEFTNVIHANYMILHQFENRHVVKGQYTFPFNFQLSSHLPGTFNLTLNKKDSINIRYFLKTQLISLNKEADLRHSTQLTVRQINKVSGPPSIQKQIITNGACCVSGGEIFLKAQLDKSIYVVGQAALLNCSIDNMNNSSTFQIKASVIQIVTVSGEQTPPIIFRNVIYEDELPLFKKKQISTFVIKLPLTLKKGKIPVQPSTSGRIINCKYEVQIEPKYSACCSSWKSPNYILPLIVQAQGSTVIIQAPTDWRPTTFDPQSLFIPNRDSFIRRQGKNPFIGIMQEDDPFIQRGG